MTRKEIAFTQVIRSRGMVVLISLAAIFMTFYAYMLGKVTPLHDFRTIALPTPSDWLGDTTQSMWCNIALTVATATVMVMVNRSFNLLRTSSMFFAAYFLITTAATPSVMGQLSASSLLALATMLAVWLMFSIYNVRASSRRVFLVFLLLGMGQLVEYSFVLYIPVLITGLGQMRIFSFKKILAAALGYITPAWTVWGLDLVPLPEMPVLEFTPPALLLGNPAIYPMLAAVALTLLTGFLLGSLNLIRIIGFNAQARSYNGLLSIVSIATGIFAIVNFTNVTFYVTLLNACVAFQVGHFFRFTVMKRGYIIMLSLIASYIALYVWALTV